MKTQETLDFDRIRDAIDYLLKNFRNQPSLEQVAKQVHLSPYHFQRMFNEWAGVSPKKFLQFITLDYAKRMLDDRQPSLFDIAHESGLSGAGRLHDLFVSIEGMSPGEYKKGGENLTIHYSFSDTQFGKVLLASTQKGVCHIAFADDASLAMQELQKMFPNSRFEENQDALQQNVLRFFQQDWEQMETVKLHLKGTDFQLKVWESLLKIPSGKLTTYGNIAQQIDHPKASRAVGSAVGDNPVAFLIPCHRVIQSSGLFGQYHWGSLRKTAMIGWEAAMSENALYIHK